MHHRVAGMMHGCWSHASRHVMGPGELDAWAGTVIHVVDTSLCLRCAQRFLIVCVVSVLQVGVFLNRLSDYLFTAARFAVSLLIRMLFLA